MAVAPSCDKCGKELTELGGLLFSPPEGKTVEKLHLCKDCYSEVREGMNS